MQLKKKDKVEIEIYSFQDEYDVEILTYEKYYDVYLSKGNIRQFVFTTAKAGMSIDMLMKILEQVIPTISLEFPFYQDSESLFVEAMEKIVVVD